MEMVHCWRMRRISRLERRGKQGVPKNYLSVCPREKGLGAGCAVILSSRHFFLFPAFALRQDGEDQKGISKYFL